MNLEEIKKLVYSGYWVGTPSIKDGRGALLPPTHLSINSSGEVYLHRIDVPFRMNTSRTAGEKLYKDNHIRLDFETELKNVQVVLDR